MKLYSHQVDALNKMKTGCILCGGVGSGKSLTSLSYYYLKCGGSATFVVGGTYARMTQPKNLYIITTARKRDTLEWEGEMCNFLLSTDPEFCHYDIKVVVDSWNNIKKYVDVEDAFFIFDEQRVVGYGAWTKSFLKIAKWNDWILLSATPGDKWEDYAPVFIANGFYKNITQFRTEHIIYKPRMDFPVVDRYVNVHRLERLRDTILIDMPFERHTVREEFYIPCTYDIPTYKYVMRERKDPDTKLPLMNVAELCYTLRTIVNTDSSRMEKVKGLVAKHKKVIIFYNFDIEREMLLHADYGEEVEVREWNGHAHEPLPTGKNWVYLVQYNAGAEGWNCVTCDTIIFFTQTYSYRTLQQAIGRIDRLNTPYKNLHYYHLISKAPIDVAITRALKNKKKFNEGAFINKKGRT